jgi:hypothetical protein
LALYHYHPDRVKQHFLVMFSPPFPLFHADRVRQVMRINLYTRLQSANRIALNCCNNFVCLRNLLLQLFIAGAQLPDLFW